MYVRPWAGCSGLTRPLSNNCRQERTKGERQRLRQNCNSISRAEKMNPGWTKLRVGMRAVMPKVKSRWVGLRITKTEIKVGKLGLHAAKNRLCITVMGVLSLVWKFMRMVLKGKSLFKLMKPSIRHTNASISKLIKVHNIIWSLHDNREYPAHAIISTHRYITDQRS